MQSPSEETKLAKDTQKDILVKKIAQELMTKNFLVDDAIIDKIRSIVSSTEFSDTDTTDVFVTSVVNALVYPRKDTSCDTEDEEKKIFCDIPTNTEVIFSYTKKPKRADIPMFTAYFKKRFEGIKAILATRPDLSAMTSISRIKSKVDKEQVSLVGMVSDKAETKNGNIILTLEDPTGEIKVLVSKDKKDLKEIADDIVLDDIIGVRGQSNGEIVFSNSLLLPEVPQTKEYKKCNDEVYACFLSDVHVGSKQFLRDNFEKFLRWIRGEAGDATQREIAARIKYIFVIGDLVDGVGIYPGQEKDLEIKDIYDQYKMFFSYFDKIPKDKTIVLTQGNHDAGRLSEPQPPLSDKFRNGADFSNFIFVSNPGMVRIHKNDKFEGFTCLLYHGYSFDYYFANVNYIRNNGGYDRADLVMKFLLQRRHLAPSYTSTLYSIDDAEDPLIIRELPDFFVTGHIHKTAVSNYKNITMISGSTWQDKTEFQEKLGHKPEPCRVPIVNLNTRDIKIIRF